MRSTVRAFVHLIVGSIALGGAQAVLWSALLGGWIFDVLVGILGICQLLTSMFVLLERRRF